jgi:hypothetical protein
MKKKELKELMEEIFHQRTLPVSKKEMIGFLERVQEAEYGDAHQESARIGAVIAMLCYLRDLDVWVYHNNYTKDKSKHGLRLMVGFEDEDELMISLNLPELIKGMFSNEDGYDTDELAEALEILKSVVAHCQEVVERRTAEDAAVERKNK